MGAHCGPRGHFWVVGGGAIPKNLSKGMCRLVLYVMMLDNRSKRDSWEWYCDVLQYLTRCDEFPIFHHHHSSPFITINHHSSSVIMTIYHISSQISSPQKSSSPTPPQTQEAGSEGRRRYSKKSSSTNLMSYACKSPT